jgi:hypothetical protein
MAKNLFSAWARMVYQQAKSIPGDSIKKLASVPARVRTFAAVNEKRRKEKLEMEKLGIRSKKTYRRYQKVQRRLRRAENETLQRNRNSS